MSLTDSQIAVAAAKAARRGDAPGVGCLANASAAWDHEVVDCTAPAQGLVVEPRDLPDGSRPVIPMCRHHAPHSWDFLSWSEVASRSGEQQ